jgi:iron complex transport system permease protein
VNYKVVASWLLIILPILMGMGSLLIGRYHIPVGDVINSLFNPDATSQTIRALVLRVRLPRILAALCVGANLALSGAVFQGLLRNPLVDSHILGLSSGAAFGAALALLAALSPVYVQLFAFAFAVLAIGSVYTISSRFGSSILVLVVTGILVSAFYNALLGIVKYVADPLDSLPAITYWLLGGLGSVRWQNLYPLLVITGFGISFFGLITWRLNVLTLSDTEAIALGVNIRRSRLAVLSVAALLVASSVSISGVIGWLGLIVPHAARALVGPDHTRLIPASIGIGALVLLVLDNVSRTAMASEIPLGILTGLIGIPAFVLLFMRTLKDRGGWS